MMTKAKAHGNELLLCSLYSDFPLIKVFIFHSKSLLRYLYPTFALLYSAIQTHY